MSWSDISDYSSISICQKTCHTKHIVDPTAKHRHLSTINYEESAMPSRRVVASRSKSARGKTGVTVQHPISNNDLDLSQTQGRLLFGRLLSPLNHTFCMLTFCMHICCIDVQVSHALFSEHKRQHWGPRLHIWKTNRQLQEPLSVPQHWSGHRC